MKIQRRIGIKVYSLFLGASGGYRKQNMIMSQSMTKPMSHLQWTTSYFGVKTMVPEFWPIHTYCGILWDIMGSNPLEGKRMTHVTGKQRWNHEILGGPACTQTYKNAWKWGVSQTLTLHGFMDTWWLYHILTITSRWCWTCKSRLGFIFSKSRKV